MSRSMMISELQLSNLSQSQLFDLIDEISKQYEYDKLKNKDLIDSKKLIESYLKNNTWEIKESASQGFSFQGLNGYLSSSLIKQYWMNNIYDNDIKKAHDENRFHIHDLGSLSTYCCGWSLEDIIIRGFVSANGNVCSKPAKHFFPLLNQTVNFMYTLQGEAAGAQALSNFDTLCAPFVKLEKLGYNQVKKYLESFIFNMNIPTRVGFQPPFTNLSFDVVCPENMKGKCCAYNGTYLKDLTYDMCQSEMDMINRAFCEIMIEGDANNSIFSFPIPTYNLTNDFDFNDPKYEKIWEMTAKYGIPYFTNFINSELNPNDFRSMCPLTGDTLITLKAFDTIITRPIEYFYKYQESDNIKFKTKSLDLYNTDNIIISDYRSNNIKSDNDSTSMECLIKNNIPSIKLLNTFPFNGTYDISWTDCIINRQSPTYIVLINTDNGQKVKLGLNHLQPVIRNDKIITIPARGLSVGEILPFYIDNKIVKSTIVNLSIIPYSDYLYCLEVDNNNQLFILENGLLTHNCRLRLDVKTLQKRNGGLFGATPLTGSIGVVTLNLPNLAYRSNSKKNFYNELDNTIDIAINSLNKKREVIEMLTENNFYPYSKIYLSDIKKRYGKYWNNHFATIGLIGMNEAISILYSNDNIITKKDFAEETLNYIQNKLLEYQKQYNILYNLEATPAESTSYRLAQRDNEIFNKQIDYYTNSSTIPVDIDIGLLNNIKHQETLQTIYTGGTVFHIYLGENINSNQARDLIKLITTNYKIPYITISPTFSICPVHKYIKGATEKCIHSDCNENCIIYSRVVGYYRPVNNWNNGKQKEFNNRIMFEYDYNKFNGDIKLIQEAESINDFIYDYNQTSVINWKDNISTVIYTSGCNLRCPWCYNHKLNTTKKKSCISLVKFINESMNNIVITGGEPTIQKNLIRVLRIFKKLGFNVKLDTNGTNPDIIQQIINERLVNSISMDIKATEDKYDKVTGNAIKNVYSRVLKTKQIIDNAVKNNIITHEYRTTIIDELCEKDVKNIENIITPNVLTKQKYLNNYKKNDLNNYK